MEISRVEGSRPPLAALRRTELKPEIDQCNHVLLVENCDVLNDLKLRKVSNLMAKILFSIPLGNVASIAQVKNFVSYSKDETYVNFEFQNILKAKKSSLFLTRDRVK